jgi:sec-independent protein translocase protein TatA
VFRQIGAPEIILILAVVVLLFGAKKLPELARGSGRALRIFKAETKGLIEDDDDAEPAEPKAITPTEPAPTSTVAQATTAEAERRPDTAD